MMKIFKKAPLAAGVVIALASGGAQAISSGTDFNLSAKAAAGGMAGAAYTMPQEASAAVFGNPATLTQFKGFNMNFGASLLGIDLVSEDLPGAFDDGKHRSDADNYIIPDVGLTLELAPGFVIGTGLEVDAGLGADYRDDPIRGLLNLVVEVISFNANLAAAYEVTDQWSVGASATIGFGLLQVGDLGGAVGGSGSLGDALGFGTTPNGSGGATASVHDIGFGFSLGTTYEIQQGLMVSGTVKSPVKYSFNNVAIGASSGVTGPNLTGDATSNGFQDTDLEQPLEVIVGIALDDVLMPGLLVEADVVWKNWSDANFYEDLWDDQILVALGAQYQAGDWTYRAGYSWAENIIKGNPSGNHVGDLTNASPGVPFIPDAVRIVQMSLAPVIWEHTVTAGIGYNFTQNVRLDAYGSYAFGETDTQDFKGVLAGGSPSGADFGGQKANAQAEWLIGAGLNVAMP